MNDRTYPPEPYGRQIGPLAYGYDPQNAPDVIEDDDERDEED